MRSALAPATRVLALVSQPIAAEGLARVLGGCPELEYLGHCDEAASALGDLTQLRPGLVLADQSFGLRFLLDFLAMTARIGVGSRVVIWCTELSAGERRQLLEAGAAGLVEQTQPIPALLQCLRAVARGGNWTGTQDEAAQKAGRRAAMRLTAREVQVLELLAKGLKNREIGERLGITPGTVKVHLTHVFEKTGARNRHELGLQVVQLLEAATDRGAGEKPDGVAAGRARQ